MKQAFELSIAPSLELKLIIASQINPIAVFAINRTISGIETRILVLSDIQKIDLSIAPSLELKHCKARSKTKRCPTINRTISGIETDWHPAPTTGVLSLSIAPSLELKPWYFVNMSKSNFLSIAPSLELKLAFLRKFHNLEFTINRTISGIETKEVRFSSSAVTAYQSHHLWNWNRLCESQPPCPHRLSIAPSLELKLSTLFKHSYYHHLSIAPSLELKLKKHHTHLPHLTPINRTISGIETQKQLICSSLLTVLSIAPSLELKRRITAKPPRSSATINRTISGIETRKDFYGMFKPAALSIAPSLELKRGCTFSNCA